MLGPSPPAQGRPWGALDAAAKLSHKRQPHLLAGWGFELD